MDATIASLIDHVAARMVNKTREEGPNARLLIGICGIPGSGKSSVARKLVEGLDGGKSSLVVGMDGWHLTREALRNMDDPEEAFAKRGAPWTFDGEAFAGFVQQVKTNKGKQTLEAPSFSHAAKDPVPGGVKVEPHHRLVVFEGLYCNVNEGAWRRGAEMLDERWVLTVDEAEAKNRLVERHVLTGVAKDHDEAVWRAENNDIPNGHYLLAHLLEPVHRIAIISDETWAGQG